MKLLTHNLLSSHVPGLRPGGGFPLRIEVGARGDPGHRERPGGRCHSRPPPLELPPVPLPVPPLPVPSFLPVPLTLPGLRSLPPCSLPITPGTSPVTPGNSSVNAVNAR